MKLDSVKFKQAESIIDMDGVHFSLDGKPCQMYFEWDTNGGDKWTFDITFNHPDIDYSLQSQGEISQAIKTALQDMAEELNADKGFVKEASLAILKVAKPLYENAPTTTASESYFGL